LFVLLDHSILDLRGLARDVTHDVTDGRRHVGGIFSRRAGRFNGKKTLKNGRK
jgi:hypothetical protein